MTSYLLFVGILLILTVLSSKLLYRFGVPTLLIFLAFGMLTGLQNVGGIYFDDTVLTQQIAAIGLMFIMFYGGFGLNWKSAKPIAVRSILLSTFGVAITAGLTGLMAYKLFNVSLLEGLLFGSVVASTDAASVFSILKSRNLNLKKNLAPLLELESGSNDPMSYLLTVLVISLLTNAKVSVPQLLFQQVFFGILFALIFSFIGIILLRKLNLEIEGLYPILLIGIVLSCYTSTEYVGGNPYLAVYILGIFIGNMKIYHKRTLIHFFDGISWLMQIVLFFTLGLLVFPSNLPNVFFQAFGLALFLVLVARPIALYTILRWFKVSKNEIIFLSWAGLRGAASIVFATLAYNSNLGIADFIFNTVFFVTLISITIQGMFMPIVAKKLNLIDDSESVHKTFSSYQMDDLTTMYEVEIKENSPVCYKSIINANIPEEILIVLIKRNNEVIVPKGNTVFRPHDVVVITCNSNQNLTCFQSL